MGREVPLSKSLSKKRDSVVTLETGTGLKKVQQVFEGCVLEVQDGCLMSTRSNVECLKM